jgi:uroporphyrinogen decarboxylase
LFSYVDADSPGLISEFLELSTDHEIMVIDAIADQRLSPCALTFGDIAFKGTLMHSPDWLLREFKPRLARLNAAWHKHGITCLFHSDGDLLRVMQDLIDTGLDGFNPIETAAGISIASIREHFGQKIFLAGGIDISTPCHLERPSL